MPKFLVTFGSDSAEVVAATPDDAWAAFCATHTAAMKHPNFYQRTITEVVPEVPVSPVPEMPAVEAEACPASPVQESEVHVEFIEPPAVSEADSAGSPQAEAIERAVAEAVEQAIEQVVQSAFESVPAASENN